MIMTTVLSCHFWPFIGFTARWLRFNIIIDALLSCLLWRIYVWQTDCPAFMQKGLTPASDEERLGMEAQLGWGRQTFKRAYCCSSHSGFDCLGFDPVWGVHVVLCYPLKISAISETLQWERYWLVISVSAVVLVIWFTSRIKERTSYMNNKIGQKKNAECVEKHLHSSPCWGRKQCASSQRYIKLTLPYFALSEASPSLIK